MFLIFLAIWTAMNVYVYLRVASVPFVRRHSRRWLRILIIVLLANAYMLARMFPNVPVVSRGLEVVGATWIATLFLLLVCMLAVDVITLFGLVFRPYVPRLRTLGAIAGLLLAALAIVQGMRAPQVKSYEVVMPHLPSQMDGMVVVLMSDLHLGSALGESWTEARVQQAMSLHPDLIVLAGDIVEGDHESENAVVAKLRGLSAPLGVFAVPGNHESYGRHDGNNDSLPSVGIRVLRNERVALRPGLVLAGVEDLTQSWRRRGNSSEPVVAVLNGVPENTATVLASHSPLAVDTAASHGVGLMLSGHTHNGQIWPFNYVVGRFYPYMYGRYQIGEMSLIVCRGTGTWGPRMRLWKPGEIVKLTLRSDGSSGRP